MTKERAGQLLADYNSHRWDEFRMTEDERTDVWMLVSCCRANISMYDMIVRISKDESTV